MIIYKDRIDCVPLSSLSRISFLNIIIYIKTKLNMAFKNIMMMITLLAITLNFTQATDILKADESEEIVDPWTKASNSLGIAQAAWEGFMNGMYKIKQAPKDYDDDTCFGSWMIDETLEVVTYFDKLFSGNITELDYE